MPKESIHDAIASEIQARINTWSAERETLLKASARIAELDEMIAEAHAELAATKAKQQGDGSKS